MITDRKKEANRENAQRSTGPKTKRGKRRARFNACTHGYFCRHLVLAGESQRRFIGIREQLLESLKPQNMAELLVVDRIVSATWKIVRLQESEAVAHGCYAKRAKRRLRKRATYVEKNYGGDDVPGIVAKLREQAKEVFPPSIAIGNTMAADNDQFERLLMYEQRLENSIHRSLRDLSLLRKNAKQTSELPDSPFTGESVIRGVEQWCQRLNERIATQHQNAQNEPTEKQSLTDEQASTCDDFSGAEETAPKATAEEQTRNDECGMQNENQHATMPPIESPTVTPEQPAGNMSPELMPADQEDLPGTPNRHNSANLPLVWIAVLLLSLCSAARAVAWEDYPGSFDLGGWSIVRNQDNHAETALLGPPHNTVIVGSAAEPLTAYLCAPDYIFAKTASGPTEKYYVIQRGWSSNRQVGDQIITKFSGPLTRAQLDANSTWVDEFGGIDWNSPRAPNGSIFWKRPGVFILYSLVVLGPMILCVLIPCAIILLLIRWLRRRGSGSGAL